MLGAQKIRSIRTLRLNSYFLQLSWPYCFIEALCDIRNALSKEIEIRINFHTFGDFIVFLSCIPIKMKRGYVYREL